MHYAMECDQQYEVMNICDKNLYFTIDRVNNFIYSVSLCYWNVFKFKKHKFLSLILHFFKNLIFSHLNLKIYRYFILLV